MKIIRNKTDLAIYGAPPAFDQPLHVGRPNVGSRDSFAKRVDEMFNNRWLTNNGPMVQELENRIAERHGVKHCIAMCNGTIALEIAIRALGLDGEVIVPSWTFIATAHALFWQGITPVFADINQATHNLDPDSVRRMITPRTSGIIGVHLWGRAAPAEELQTIANEHEIKLMFDAAHAFGSTYKGDSIGRFGSCEVLSFHATKSFNSFEGGAALTDDDELAEAMRLMRNFGFKGYDNVIYPGTNGKMVEVCAAMGLSNLDCYDEVVASNRQNYLNYRRALSDVPYISLLPYDPIERNSYHYIVVEVMKNDRVTRDQIVTTLQAENVLARKYFWPGAHKMKPYRDLFPHAGMRLQNTELLAERIIVLPNGPDVTSETIDLVRDVISMILS